MKLYLTFQTDNNDYDTFDSLVVCANTEEEARKILPDDDCKERYWTQTEDVKVEYLGEAKKGSKKGVILASFNAG